MTEAIIFDLDGTLWEATTPSLEAWNAVLAKYGMSDIRLTSEWVHTLMGKTMHEIADMMASGLSREKQDELLDEFGKTVVAYLRRDGAVLYDGLEDTLRELSRTYRLYIVSNCVDGYVQAFLYAHKLEPYFADIEMYGRTGLGKADNIRLLMERNSIRRAVYVGDTAGDEQSAQEAGIPFIHARYGFGTADAPAATVDAITDLPACMRAFDEKKEDEK